MSEIKEKVENELKTVKSLCETIEHAIKTQIDKGLDKVDTHELFEAVDIYKDLGEVKKNIIDGCYKMQIMEAMEKSEYGEDYDENGQIDRKGYNAYRYADGRYAPKGRGMRRGYMYPAEYYRDMDKWDGKMYYSEQDNVAHSVNTGNATDNYQRGYDEGNREGYQRGYSEAERMNMRDAREGKSGMSRKAYVESKSMDNTAKMKELERYMNDLSSDLTEVIAKATPDEKTMLKNKLSTLATKIQ